MRATRHKRFDMALYAVCKDSTAVENQITQGETYRVKSIDRHGSETYYTVRTDAGDLGKYGAHRFDIRPMQ